MLRRFLPSLNGSTTSVSSSKRFEYPLGDTVRVAVFSESLALLAAHMRVSEDRPIDLQKAKAQTSAAPVSRILDLATEGWNPSMPLVVFTGHHHGFLVDYLRNEIWVRYGVPVFEQLLDVDGSVIARECEAHDGLHVDPSVQVQLADRELLVNGKASGLASRIGTTLCGCGVPGTRLFDTRFLRTHLLPAFHEAEEYSRLTI